MNIVYQLIMLKLSLLLCYGMFDATVDVTQKLAHWIMGELHLNANELTIKKNIHVSETSWINCALIGKGYNFF